MGFEILVFVCGGLFSVTVVTAYVAFTTSRNIKESIEKQNKYVDSLLSSKKEELVKINQLHTQLTEGMQKNSIEISNIKQEISAIKASRTLRT